MARIDWEGFGQKYFLIIMVIIAIAYGVEGTLNNQYKNDCVKVCLTDTDGPDFKYVPINILPIYSAYSSVSNTTRLHSDCACYNQNELDQSTKKAAELKKWSEEYL
ncbi:MAG: hypothetical protein COB51_04340 [Moraxellaceae bacterium]|nr:MAG: hypothetical protein COB51_04340 [Moraxellaceae bacterium]